MVHLYYDSKTGNVQRFIQKVAQITGWQVHKIEDGLKVCEAGHLVTYTTKLGCVPDNTRLFMDRHADMIYSVTSSGNRNWGKNFGLAANKVSEDYDVPLAMKFELSGTMEDIHQFIDIIKHQYNDSKRGSKKLDIA
ncbi:protein involved in ribonucleotide reduction [Sphingobacterium allocomposti]|jgi:protein involved in ribonucleotide reduction|uniref:Protein involved in ribonucleotide reduction n=1 Tax=Sphingobacterium allocomposti TaxID=415956 RepID=A0A5S5DJW0_9SPHI|nr:class Ib ribonucleoside-diphosphate reductase assembly flavoprotein NrdI [Sphingobacterium composti Yoo et al. 2007 non Ten et al. 2007]TYP95904.1 protein involved in ribonucleotide reduction [Sphingobacterium composti Yoo et al. 2007 non Ten et al. 2007]HLS95808.1 class Ib ribonucleoside-diphosphate reductase assembly flavoprotein NrdI [Sphingobacterium sp.]